jgi:hypothetical protein
MEPVAEETIPGLDAQLAELVETVWGCERAWSREDRFDAVARYAVKHALAGRGR